MEQTVQDNQKQKNWFEWAQVICIALIAVTCLYTFVCRMVDVHGTSMENTLYNGERLLLSSLPYTPAYGDIVVINRGESEEPLIKRVIGLAGDTIRVDAGTGTVYRNDEPLNEPYVHDATAVEKMPGPVTVPESMIFVMGDNRATGHSLDSRTFGCVPQKDVVGKAFFRVSPLNKLGGLR